MIRKATPSDATTVARLMMQAMEEVVSRLTGAPYAYTELPFLEHFIKLPQNQYSFENTLVALHGGAVCGSLTAYDGAQLHKLRQPILEYLNIRGIQTEEIEDETGPGEFYIDTISVSPQAQGTGIGTTLLKAGIEFGIGLGHATIGLLVHPSNPKAKRFYKRMGFAEKGTRHFMGVNYLHMQYQSGLADSKTEN